MLNAEDRGSGVGSRGSEEKNGPMPPQPHLAPRAKARETMQPRARRGVRSRSEHLRPRRRPRQTRRERSDTTSAISTIVAAAFAAAHPFPAQDPTPSAIRTNLWRRPFAVILDCVCRDSGTKKVARGASAFCEHPWLSMSIRSCRASGTGSSNEDASRLPVPLTRHKNYVPRYQGCSQKAARTPGYLLLPLSRRLVGSFKLARMAPSAGLDWPSASSRASHRFQMRSKRPISRSERAPDSGVGGRESGVGNWRHKFVHFFGLPTPDPRPPAHSAHSGGPACP
jgi:hypothetical protein